MRLRKIKLFSDYKCFKAGTEFKFYDENIICIVGKNSAGKTILLNLIKGIFNQISNYYLKENISFGGNYLYCPNNSYKFGFGFEITLYRKNIEYIFNSITLEMKKNSYLITCLSQDEKDFFSYYLGNLRLRVTRHRNYLPQKILDLVNIKRINQDFSTDIIIKNNDCRLETDDLSDGEQSIINTFNLLYQLQEKRELFILDEPDKTLNNEIKRKYITLLEEVIAEKDTQIIFSTHSTELISDLRETQVYKLENFELKNINFNPFGEDAMTINIKIFNDLYGISDKARNKYEEYENKIKEYEIGGNIEGLENLISLIKREFADTIKRVEILEKIENILSIHR